MVVKWKGKSKGTIFSVLHDRGRGFISATGRIIKTMCYVNVMSEMERVGVVFSGSECCWNLYWQ